MRAGTLPLVLVALLPALPAAAGVIRGTVWMDRSVAALVHKSTPAADIVRAQRGVDEGVVWVESVPDAVERRLSHRGFSLFFWRRKPAHVPTIVQAGRQFDPHVMVVTAGTDVEFRNLDTVYHNAFSVSAANRFDLGKYPPGRADTVAFPRAGVVNLHCDIHPEMLGFVVVTPNHVYARPDSTGAFELPRLPPGRYTLHAWQPRRGELKRTIELPKQGDAVVDLRF